MKILLDDLSFNENLFPFAQIESLVHLRIGILSLYEKWNLLFPGNVFVASELEPKAKLDVMTHVPANLLAPFEAMHQLKKDGNVQYVKDRAREITRSWQIFEWNDFALREDFAEITKGRYSQPLPDGVYATGPENIFIEEGATILHSSINASAGPVYIGENALIMEGSLLRGPLAVCHGAVVKMGTKIYGATTIGAQCTVGGEVKNSVLQDFSNKAHDGYLGDSVIGNWCNLGAGTTNSNIKNNASPVVVWSQAAQKFENAGLKCGLLMGDYSRAAINTSFNTGTVTGICCHIFAKDVPPKLIDNFTWGREKYVWDKVIPDIQNWKTLREKKISSQKMERIKNLYDKNEKE